MLDNVRSLNNIGSIFRTADGFACREVVLCGISATPPSPEIHKTALGAEDSVDWRYFPTTAEAVSTLRAEGCRIACLELVRESVSLADFRVEPGVAYALVVGHEVEGIDPAIVDRCRPLHRNTAVRNQALPQRGCFHSNSPVGVCKANEHTLSKICRRPYSPPRCAGATL